MKTIIIATDFSAAATNAAYYAADMAMGVQAHLLLFYTYRVPVVFSEVPVAMPADDLKKEGEQQLARLKEQLLVRTNHALPITYLVTQGDFLDELTLLCAQEKPYVVVMGSQGATSAQKLLFGEHTLNAMKHLSWPLLAVPVDSRFAEIKTIGLACDFDNVEAAVPTEELRLLVRDFNAKLHILNTGKRSEFDPDVVFESGILQGMIKDLEPAYHFITHKDVDQGIIDFVEKSNIDLLVVLPKRRGLLQQMMHRSHTRQLVLHSHVPVMALHTTNDH